MDLIEAFEVRVDAVDEIAEVPGKITITCDRNILATVEDEAVPSTEDDLETDRENKVAEINRECFGIVDTARHEATTFADQNDLSVDLEALIVENEASEDRKQDLAAKTNVALTHKHRVATTA